MRKRIPESTAGRVVAGGVLAVSAFAIALAQRDLQRRPQDEVRGPKILWRLACLNGLGALAYLRWGRITP